MNHPRPKNFARPRNPFYDAAMQAAYPAFQPTLLGLIFSFDGEGCSAMVTDETVDAVFVESRFFTGWISKADFWVLGGDRL
jgi:hypothetical protein